MARRREAAEAAARVAVPILEGLGLELVDVEVHGPGRDPVLRFLVDRPGGVTLDELERASGALETALDVAEVLPGRHRLEVSSPGIDRPWKRARDFEQHVGARAAITLAAALPDGRRRLVGTVTGVAGDVVRFLPDGGEPLALALADIATARPELDWAALLRGGHGGRGA